ncbi:MAG: PEGA domain-containing protein, partial [Deltaproteobacteria bacterium]|nr:PEGA domain-containing protein [Deltaproteobacteria bacterium]
MRGSLASITACAVLLAFAPPAGADEAKKAAKQHFNDGVKLYKNDDFTGALAEFLKAYELKPHHAVLYNIANCQKNLEDYAPALMNFREYLEEGGDKIPAGRRKEVGKSIDELLELLSQVTLTSNVEGAVVLIDGKEIGTTPHP